MNSRVLSSARSSSLASQQTFGTDRQGTRSFNKLVLGALLLSALLAVGSTPGFSASGHKSELIKAYALGTDSQIGARFVVTLDIYGYSTPEDRQVLAQALQTGGNDGLANALSKLKPVGHCTISGNPGYYVTYIHAVQTATGRKIQFVARRQLRSREAYHDTRTAAYDLTAGEFNLDDAHSAVSTGLLYPEARISLDEQGQVRFDLAGNPYKLESIVDWKGTAGKN